MSRPYIDAEMTMAMIELARKYFRFHYCPNCGKILSRVRHPIWSHDHSLEIGYTLVSECVFCLWSEEYTDVE